jgi:hypothetical protein
LNLAAPVSGGVDLLSADEVRPAEFGATAKSAIHPDMVAIPEAIIERRSGAATAR